MSERVVQAVADHRGVDPRELDESLYSVINPEALDALFSRPPEESGVQMLRFRYLGHRVIVEADCTITVTD
ncbi:HalOD1 output domain-containing protein [Halomicroarcula sp. GCM10025324]|jgi:hypothetical protein|uniref:HalOD1 output domain-containing protein n=1 Tax=Haloarcula TaxID=2237 RepID=UPI0023E75BF7|nr:HalOD1 output domain-containing protein [Halomicroarcula sp. ZS-22-S1]